MMGGREVPRPLESDQYHLTLMEAEAPVRWAAVKPLSQRMGLGLPENISTFPSPVHSMRSHHGGRRRIF